MKFNVDPFANVRGEKALLYWNNRNSDEIAAGKRVWIKYDKEYDRVWAL